MKSNLNRKLKYNIKDRKQISRIENECLRNSFPKVTDDISRTKNKYHVFKMNVLEIASLR